MSSVSVEEEIMSSWVVVETVDWIGFQVLSSHLPSRSSPDIFTVLSLPPNLHNMKPTPAKGIFSYVCYGLCISARAFLLVTPAPSKGNRQLFSLLHGTYSLIGGKLPCSCPFPFQTLSQSLFFCHDVHRGSWAQLCFLLNQLWLFCPFQQLILGQQTSSQWSNASLLWL